MPNDRLLAVGAMPVASLSREHALAMLERAALECWRAARLATSRAATAASVGSALRFAGWHRCKAHAAFPRALATSPHFSALRPLTRLVAPVAFTTRAVGTRKGVCGAALALAAITQAGCLAALCATVDSQRARD